MSHLVLGTRRSRLARWQTDHVIGLLQAVYPNLDPHIEVISTKGDQILDKALPEIGGKGLFTEALEASLRNQQIDVAVHSLKDLPTESVPELTVGAIPERAPVGDVLISRGGHTIQTLPDGASVGTSSLRRAAQLRHRRPDLNIIDIRGNVPTRIEKALDANGPYDAIVLAEAGVTRLELTEHITERLALDVMLPAPGQGALGIQCREQGSTLQMLQDIHDVATHTAVTAERAFLRHLGGGCAVPVAAYAQISEKTITMTGRVISIDGQQLIEVRDAIDLTEDSHAAQQADALGSRMAKNAIERGASEILEMIR